MHFPNISQLLLFLEEKVVFCQLGFAVPTPHCCENNSWHVESGVCWELGQTLVVYLVIFPCCRLWGRTSTIFAFQTRTLQAQCLSFLHQATELAREVEERLRTSQQYLLFPHRASISKNWKLCPMRRGIVCKGGEINETL